MDSIMQPVTDIRRNIGELIVARRNSPTVNEILNGPYDEDDGDILSKDDVGMDDGT